LLLLEILPPSKGQDQKLVRQKYINPNQQIMQQLNQPFDDSPSNILSLFSSYLIQSDRLNNHAFDYLHYHVILRSEEHTSELQSRFELVCRLLLENKNSKYRQETF